MRSEEFQYIKDKTKKVCRSCGNKYDDFFFADESGDCEDCGITSGHLGFTNQSFVCPKCKSTDLKNIKGGYSGCITDEDRHGQSMGCGIDHDGLECNRCGFAFFFGEEFEVEDEK